MSAWVLDCRIGCATAASAQISIAEYLHTSYRPDREYRDGEVLERNVGRWEHSRVQALLAAWFGAHEREWQVMISTEQRLQVAASRIRIPDVVLVRPGPQPDVLSHPPVVVIEILSPDDSYSDIQRRAEDYQSMGVATIWIIDPATRTGRVCVGNTGAAATRLEVPGLPIYVDLNVLFASIGQPL